MDFISEWTSNGKRYYKHTHIFGGWKHCTDCYGPDPALKKIQQKPQNDAIVKEAEGLYQQAKSSLEKAQKDLNREVEHHKRVEKGTHEQKFRAMVLSAAQKQVEARHAQFLRMKDCLQTVRSNKF